MKSFVSSLEPLESRIAPAAVFVNAFNATYNDVDGDHVLVHFTKPILTVGNVSTVCTFNGGGYLSIDLTTAVAPSGTGIAVSVTGFAPGSDHLVNVGYINSASHDLGNITVKGDLGRIDAGDATTATPGLNALAVRSLGRLGTDTQDPGSNPTLASNIVGKLGALTVGTLAFGGDVKDASVSVTGGADGKIGPIIIHGSLIGGSNANSGKISSEGAMKAVTIDHNLQGGTGTDSGFINSLGKIGAITVRGSIVGGTNLDSGVIVSGGDMGAAMVVHNIQGGPAFRSGVIVSGGKLASVFVGGSLIGGSLGAPVAPASNGAIYSAGDMGKVTIGHDVQGGADVTACGSGVIFSGGTMGIIGGVNIGGSLIGGEDCNSGTIDSLGDMGAVKIGHDVTSGSLSITATAELCKSGIIQSINGRISSVHIGGSIVSGIDANSTFDITESASIRAGDSIGSVTVDGSLVGHGDLGTGATPVVISARGQHTQTKTDLAIGSLTIGTAALGGHVEFANILAGYNVINLNAVNPDAQIGRVLVHGDWVASNLVAGAMNTASLNMKFGDTNDAKITGGTPDAPLIFSKIASITIKGKLFGTPVSTSGADQFGFVAEQIGSLQIDGFAVNAPTTSAPLAIGETTDVNIHTHIV